MQPVITPSRVMVLAAPHAPTIPAMTSAKRLSFFEKINFQGWLATALARGQYAACVFHLPIVLLVQYAMLGVALPPLAKFAIVALAAVPLTFLYSYWIRKPLRM